MAVGTRRKLGWVAVLYFAEGLPFGMVLDHLPVYFRAHGVSLTDIGIANLVRAPWWAKVFWAQLVDRVGTRKTWILASLVIMAAALVVAGTMPAAPVGLALLLVLLAFTTAAATQDVAIDAYTIELLSRDEVGIANGVRVSAYRAALIVAGGVLVGLSGLLGWPGTFVAAAAVLLLIAVAVSRMPVAPREPLPRHEWLHALRAWAATPGWPGVMLFILLFKLGDAAMGPMVKPFWVDRGLSVEEIALVSTTLGVGASVAGSLVGGALTSRWGVVRALWLLGLAQAFSNLGYAAVAWTGAGRPGVYAASLVESFTGGLGTAAFLAFLMTCCDKRQAATEYALLSALFNLSGWLVSGLSGLGAQRLGYAPYFALTFALALPSFALLPWVQAWLTTHESEPQRAQSD